MPDLKTVVEDPVCEENRAVARISLHFARDGKQMRGEIIDLWHLSLGGLSRVTFQMGVATLPQERLLNAMRLIGSDVRPAVHAARASL